MWQFHISHVWFHNKFYTTQCWETKPRIFILENSVSHITVTYDAITVWNIFLSVALLVTTNWFIFTIRSCMLGCNTGINGLAGCYCKALIAGSHVNYDTCPIKINLWVSILQQLCTSYLFGSNITPFTWVSSNLNHWALFTLPI